MDKTTVFAPYLVPNEYIGFPETDGSTAESNVPPPIPVVTPTETLPLLSGVTLDTAVDPSNPGNPNYSLGTKYGSCMVSLNVTQIPSHSHTATNTVIDVGHFHYLSTVSGQTSKPALSPNNYLASVNNAGNDGNYALGGTLEALPNVGKSSTSTTNISVQTSLSNVGGGLGHNNVQPSIGCYYIMYIPS